jgi:tetratricopeptide (TPR) repeat protein
MARADRRRVARTKAAAPRSRYESAYVGTEDLFFQRLRRQAKWMFVFLALVFGVGFVAFGVGSDVQGGIADVLGVGGSGSGQPSVSDAEDRLDKNPNDTQAMRDLATALQTDGRPEEAIEPLAAYTLLKPRDEDALRELGGLFLTKASRLRNELQIAQAEAFALNPGADFLPPADSPFGRAVGQPPISQAVSSGANERLNTLFSEQSGAYDQAKTAYQQLAKLVPNDASVQIQLADAAQNAGDTETALAAYRKFLKLAPDDPSAPLVRQEIKRLESSGPVIGTTGG